MTFTCQWGRVKRLFSFCEYFSAAERRRQKPGVGSCSNKWGQPSSSYSQLPSPPTSPWAGTCVVHPEDTNLPLRPGSTWIHEQFQISLRFNRTRSSQNLRKKKKVIKEIKACDVRIFCPFFIFVFTGFTFVIGWGWRGKMWH